tara:strand:+ start:205 stop:609 length:405 start_codon:yes stop_codon:yes gene_type:complete
MAAAKHNIEIEQGIDFSLEIQLKDAAGGVIDLSGYNGGSSTTAPHFLAKIKRSPEVSTEAAVFTTDLLAVDTDNDTPNSGADGRTGRVALKLTAANTLALTNTSYVYDLYRKDSANKWHRDLEGTVTVIEGVSR